MIEEQIKQIKKKYLRMEPKINQSEGLSDMWNRVDRRRRFSVPWYVVLSIVLIISAGSVKTIEASQPGSPLYPVKEKVAEIVTYVKETISPYTNPEPEIKEIIKPTMSPTPTIQPEQNNEFENTPNKSGDNHGKSVSTGAKQNKEKAVKGEKTENSQGKSNNIPSDNQSANSNNNSNSDNENKENQGNSQNHRQDENNKDNKGQEISNEKKNNNHGKPN